MPSPDYAVTLQILRMLRALEGSGLRARRVRDLAADLDVHPRTVKRWVDALSQAMDQDDGSPLVRRELRAGEAWICMPRTTPGPSSSIFQYASAYAAWAHLSGPDGSLLSDSARDLVDQAGDNAPAHLAPYLARVPTAFCAVPFAPKDYRVHEDVLDAVLGAVLRNQPVSLDYRNIAGRASVQEVDPLTIVMYREGLYLLARWQGDTQGAHRLYAIDRIADVRVDRTARFALPRRFDPAKAFRDVLGLWRTDVAAERVEVAFTPAVVDVVRSRQFAGFAGWRVLPDGRSVLMLDLPVTPEVRSWVLSWGLQAEVLAPAAFRRDVADELATALGRYRE